jgi:hypothetical protein
MKTKPNKKKAAKPKDNKFIKILTTAKSKVDTFLKSFRDEALREENHALRENLSNLGKDCIEYIERMCLYDEKMPQRMTGYLFEKPGVVLKLQRHMKEFKASEKQLQSFRDTIGQYIVWSIENLLKQGKGGARHMDQVRQIFEAADIATVVDNTTEEGKISEILQQEVLLRAKPILEKAAEKEYSLLCNTNSEDAHDFLNMLNKVQIFEMAELKQYLLKKTKVVYVADKKS